MISNMIAEVRPPITLLNSFQGCLVLTKMFFIRSLEFYQRKIESLLSGPLRENH